jgi:hypothetical protein
MRFVGHVQPKLIDERIIVRLRELFMNRTEFLINYFGRKKFAFAI